MRNLDITDPKTTYYKKKRKVKFMFNAKINQ